MEQDRELYGRGYAQVDLDAVISNAISIKEHIAPETKLIAVVKTDGYGHGSIPLAKALEKLDFMYGFAVATEEEALELTEAGIRLPVIILGYTFPYAYEALALQGIEAAVFRYDTLREMSAAAKRTGKSIRVHIKVDTGMGRIGILPEDTGMAFIKTAMETEGIEIAGIFTHFARADEKDKTSAYGQLRLFREFTEQAKRKLGLKGVLEHCANSAAAMEMPEANMDAVRAGIILYGLRPSRETDMDQIPLKPALSFFSTVIYVKDMPAGCPVSYGGTYVTNRRTRVATVPVGYGDGYPRSLSNKGHVLIKGRKAPILGKVCMDQLMVDVTEIPGVTEGERVTLIGRDGTEEITAELLGEMSGKFNYELLCGLGKRIPRLYIGG